MQNVAEQAALKIRSSVGDSRQATGNSILVIDDSDLTQRLLGEILRPKGFQVHAALSGEEGLRRFFETRPDLVLLDVVLPGLDGFETCQRLLELTDVPVLFLTSIGDEDSIVRGLELGAVDYIVKPFTAKILLARISVALRYYVRTPDEPPAIAYDDGYLRIDVQERRIAVDGKPVKLTSTEFALLTYLFENAGSVLTFAQILDHVWGWDPADRTNVYTYIRRLRHKLEPDADSPRYITVEHGTGYRFEKHI